MTVELVSIKLQAYSRKIPGKKDLPWILASTLFFSAFQAKSEVLPIYMALPWVGLPCLQYRVFPVRLFPDSMQVSEKWAFRVRFCTQGAGNR